MCDMTSFRKRKETKISHFIDAQRLVHSTKLVCSLHIDQKSFSDFVYFLFCCVIFDVSIVDIFTHSPSGHLNALAEVTCRAFDTKFWIQSKIHLVKYIP